MAFGWQSAGHAFACLFRDIVTFSKKVVAVLSGLQADVVVIESPTALISPQAAAVDKTSFGAASSVTMAIDYVAFHMAVTR